MTVRLAHLVSHPIQYFAPLYRELASRDEIDLTVYFYSRKTVGEFYDNGFGRQITWDTPLLTGYRAVFPRSARRTSIYGGPLRRRNFDLIADLLRHPPDLVWVHGYAHLTAWLAFAASRLHRRPFLLRDEQTLLRSRSRWRRLAKRVALPLMLRHAVGLYIGKENRLYLREYGVSEERLHPVPYAVDNDYFRAAAAKFQGRRDRLRREFGVSDDAPVLLFVGKLTPQKNPLVLLKAFAEVRRHRRCWLLFVGDGVLRTAIEEESRTRNIPNVLVSGFRNQTELPQAYSAADVLILPSLSETWGLVVNEAMNFSLPVVVSDQVGCAADLVADGHNGFVVPTDSVGGLAAALARLVDDHELREAFGARSAEIVESYSIKRCADAIVAACLASARAHNGKGEAA
jgi:glycosyltransferase involved in cell wall biosynthesis